ncbi:MAG TPA: EAL domain-containing protein [Myxococcota bacterium]|nr:EAL domain-containing protein [Myxococcota bacterium]
MTDAPPPSPPAPDAKGAHGRVLIAEDEPGLLRAYARALTSIGYTVDQASNGQEASDLIGVHDYDVILSDISMPGMTGLELLRAVRARDLDVPVVLMTGGPALETALQAVEYGATRYLLKPIEPKTLREVVAHAARLREMARLKRQALALLGTQAKGVGDRAGLESSLGRALETLWIAFQPIVSWSDRRVIAYEALVRSEEKNLPHPGALFDAAERLGRLHELGRAIRDRVAATLAESPPALQLYVNLHTLDLTDDMLFQRTAPLSAFAGRIVLEITERASLEEVRDVRGCVSRLREMGFKIALDDLGAGYAGLTSFATLEPEVVKLDMSLVRGIDREPTRQRLVRSMVALCREQGMLVIAEGIETVAERDMVLSLGCDLLQGFLFARPGRPFPEVTW